ncbi:MAG: D-glycerate dehydrogenase [Pseudomonadota bacterium]
MSGRPRILAARRLPDNVTARLEHDYDATLNPVDEVLDTDELVARAAGHGGLIIANTEQVDASVVAALPESVRIIATFSVGYEHIDVDAASARGITVTNTPDVLTDATADVTMLCLLGAARRATESLLTVREHRWTGWTTTMLLGTHVTGKRIGIFGMGRIGQALARRARGFDMQVHYLNRRRLPPEVEGDATFHDDEASFLANCDFLCLNAPSTPATIGYLNAARIAQLPDGAVVVNTARGNLVDDEALLAALKSGKVAAAGLDVFNGEPRLHPEYQTMMNVFALPHVGSATVETRDAMGFVCLDNLDAYFTGQPVPNALAALPR